MSNRRDSTMSENDIKTAITMATSFRAFPTRDLEMRVASPNEETIEWRPINKLALSLRNLIDDGKTTEFEIRKLMLLQGYEDK